MKRDPIEETKCFKEISSEVEDKLKEILKDINHIALGIAIFIGKRKRNYYIKTMV